MSRIFGPAQKIRQSGKLPDFLESLNWEDDIICCILTPFLLDHVSLKEPLNLLGYYKLDYRKLGGSKSGSGRIDQATA